MYEALPDTLSYNLKNSPSHAWLVRFCRRRVEGLICGRLGMRQSSPAHAVSSAQPAASYWDIRENSETQKLPFPMWPKLMRAAQTNRKVKATNDSLNARGAGGSLEDSGGAM
jgi:hypothetical protein